MADNKSFTPAQWRLALLIFALAAARLAYGVISENGLRETAALFIGLPALLAIIITLTPKAKSVTGMVIKGIIIAMLMSGILLQEGLVCILMAAPLFLAVGLAIGTLFDHYDKKSLKVNVLLLIPFILLSFEGTTETLSFAREQVIVIEKTVSLNEVEIAARLTANPTFTRPLPLFLQLGFPRPTQAAGAGLDVGDERIISFGQGSKEMGHLKLIVSQRSDNQVQFQAMSDSTPIAKWLTWQTTQVTWQAIDDQQTRVRLTITAERRLAPAFYFGPLEKFGLYQAGNYLAGSLFALETGD